MVNYECKLCNYITIRKSNYSKHLKTKKHLSNYNNSEDKVVKSSKKDHKKTILGPFSTTKETILGPQKDHFETNSDFFCEFCEKSFKNKTHLYRHQKHYCKVIKENNDEVEELKTVIEENKKEKEKLYKYIDKLIEKTGDTIIENQTNNQLNNHTNNNNIHLNNFGEEDISHITDKFKMQMLKLPYGGIQKMIEKVHFSDKKPQNRNIALTNKREKMIKVLNKKKWKYQDKDCTIDELIRKNYNRLDEYYEEFAKQLMIDRHKKRYEIFQKKFDTYDENLMKKIKKDTEMILLSENL